MPRPSLRSSTPPHRCRPRSRSPAPHRPPARSAAWPSRSEGRRDPEELIAPLDAPVQGLINRARHIIAAVDPGLTEQAYPGWRGIGYRHPRAGYLCCIFPFPDRVDVAFEYGALLDDPGGELFKGPTGSKRVRYLRLLPATVPPLDALAQLVAASIALRTR